MIRAVTLQDTSAITAIYNEYIAHSTSTFDIEPVSEEEMQKRISEISARYPYFVYETDGEIVGYCYAHPWKEREAYNRTLDDCISVACPYGKRTGPAAHAASDRRMQTTRHTCPDSLYHE